MKKSLIRLSAVLPFAAGGVLFLVSGCSPMGGVPTVPPGVYVPDATETEIETPKTRPAVGKPDSIGDTGLQGGDSGLQGGDSGLDGGIPANPDILYVSRQGDTLQSIGRVYGVSANDLAIVNNLPANKTLKPGTQVRIPADLISTKNAKPVQQVKYTGPKQLPPPPPPVKKPEAKPAKPEVKSEGEKIHIVKSGDMLSKLAVKYHVYAIEIARANNIDLNARLKIGQKLVIPATTKKGVKAVAPKMNGKTAKPEVKPAKPEVKPAKPEVKPEVKPVEPLTPVPDKKNVDELFDADPVSSSGSAAKPVETTASVEKIESMSFTLEQDMTPDKIAEIIGCPVETLLKLNPTLERNSTVPTGTQVQIPVEIQ